MDIPAETSVVVLEPGSETLKIAFLSHDVSPCTVPAAVCNTAALRGAPTVPADPSRLVNDTFLVGQDAVDFVAANPSLAATSPGTGLLVNPIKGTVLHDPAALDALLVHTLGRALPALCEQAIDASTRKRGPISILGQTIDPESEAAAAAGVISAEAANPLVTGITSAVDRKAIFVLLSFPTGWTKVDLATVTRILFQSCNVAGVFHIDQPLCAAYGCNFTAPSLVLDVGHAVTNIAPVVGDSTFTLASRDIPLGGLHVEHALAAKLVKDVDFLNQLKEKLPDLHDIACSLTPLPHDSGVKIAPGKESLASSAKYDLFMKLVRKIKEAGGVCDIGSGVLLLPAGGAVAMTKAAKKAATRNIAVANSHAAGSTSPTGTNAPTMQQQSSIESNESADSTLETKTVTVMWDLVPNSEPLKLEFSILLSTLKGSFEVLFHPSDFGYDVLSIVEGCELVLEQIDDPERRLNLCENIILIGGTTGAENFRAKLIEEVAAFIAASETSNEYQAREIKFSSFPEFFAAYKGRDADAAILGATIVARLVFLQNGTDFVSRADYNRVGAALAV